MGKKGEQTRLEIVRASADLMNRHGFLRVSLAEITDATGIQKGGLYRYFASREELACCAFDHAVAAIRARFVEALEGKVGARAQLLAVIGAYAPAAHDVPLPGGCPIMNGAIESDHANPVLRARARKAMDAWRNFLSQILQDGAAHGELRRGLDFGDVASVIIGCLEGAVMLSQLYGDAQPLRAATSHLTRYIEEDLCA